MIILIFSISCEIIEVFNPPSESGRIERIFGHLELTLQKQHKKLITASVRKEPV